MKFLATLAFGLSACALQAQTTYTYNDLGDANSVWEYQPGSYYAPATIGRMFGNDRDAVLQHVTCAVGTVTDVHLRMFIYEWSNDMAHPETTGAPLFESSVHDLPANTSLATFDVPNLFFGRGDNKIIIFSGQGLERSGHAYFSGIDSGGTAFVTSTYRDGDKAFNDLSKWGNPDADNYWNRDVPTLAVKLEFGTPVPEPTPILAFGVSLLLIQFRQRSRKRVI